MRYGLSFGIGHPDPCRGDEVLVGLRFCCANPDMVERAGCSAAFRHSCPQPMRRMPRMRTGRSPRDGATARSTLHRFDTRAQCAKRRRARFRRSAAGRRRELGRELEAVGVGLDLVVVEVVGAGDVVVLDDVRGLDVLGDLADRLDGVEEELPGGLVVPSPNPAAWRSRRGRRSRAAASTRRRRLVREGFLDLAAGASMVIWVAARGLWWPNSRPIAQPRRYLV